MASVSSGAGPERPRDAAEEPCGPLRSTRILPSLASAGRLFGASAVPADRSPAEATRARRTRSWNEYARADVGPARGVVEHTVSGAGTRVARGRARLLSRSRAAGPRAARKKLCEPPEQDRVPRSADVERVTSAHVRDGGLSVNLSESDAARRLLRRPLPRPAAPVTDVRPDAPLADRMRPRTLDEILGQEEVLAPGKPLRRAIETDYLRSLILWGPPGSGKTTLAHVIRRRTRAPLRGDERRALGRQGAARGPAATPRSAASASSGAPSCSSTRSTATTRRSRTRCSRTWSRATWC